jgi:Zn-dependent membrane protease YugP
VGQKAFAFKMAIAAHECGHAEQRKFLIAWTVTSLVAAVASLLVFLFVPFPALILSSLLLFIGIIVLVTPLITFAYEVNASQRAIVNLIAYQYLTTGGEAREAAHTLQLAASTYLLNLVIFLFQFTAQLLTLLAKFRSP